jgi:hypothetical protein
MSCCKNYNFAIKPIKLSSVEREALFSLTFLSLITQFTNVPEHLEAAGWIFFSLDFISWILYLAAFLTQQYTKMVREVAMQWMSSDLSKIS